MKPWYFPKTAPGAPAWSAARLPRPGISGHFVRGGGAQRQNPVHRTVLLLLGQHLLSGADLCPVRQDSVLSAAQSAGGPAAPAAAHGIRLPGAGIPQPAHRLSGPEKQHLLPLRRAGRALRRPGFRASTLGRGPAGRGGTHAPLLCGAGMRPVFRRGEPPVVLLQPRRALPLVLPGMGAEGQGKRGFTPDLYHRDNPGLSSAVLERYERLFQGTFYRRFVLGEWVPPRGLSTTSSPRTWPGPSPPM